MMVKNNYTMKRLQRELKVLKGVNKPLYMIGKKDLLHIKACEKQGFSPTKIDALI